MKWLDRAVGVSDRNFWSGLWLSGGEPWRREATLSSGVLGRADKELVMLRGSMWMCVAAVCAVWVTCGLGGCTSPARPPERTTDAYQGPTITIDSSGNEHIILVAAPTGGWDVRLDRLMEGPGYTEAFVTIREPNPLFVNAQVMVTHRLASKVATTVPCHVLARVKGHDNEDPDVAYAKSTEAGAKPAPPAKPDPKPVKVK